MTGIAGLELETLHGRGGYVVIRARVVLQDAVLGAAAYPLKRVEDVKEFLSVEKEVSKIEGRLSGVLRDVPSGATNTVESVCEDVFSKANLDFRFVVGLAHLNALAEQRGTDAAALVGGEFLAVVPLPIVRVSRLAGPIHIPLALVPSGPLEEQWFVEQPLPQVLDFDLEHPEPLSRALAPVVASHGLLLDLRGLTLESRHFAFFEAIASHLFYLLDPEGLAYLGRLSPPNLTEILDRSVLRLELDQLDQYEQVLQRLLPVHSFLVAIPPAMPLSASVRAVRRMLDAGLLVALDLRSDVHDGLDLWPLARGLRLPHVWANQALENALRVLDRSLLAGKRTRDAVYRPFREVLHE